MFNFDMYILEFIINIMETGTKDVKALAALFGGGPKKSATIPFKKEAKLENASEKLEIPSIFGAKKPVEPIQKSATV